MTPSPEFEAMIRRTAKNPTEALRKVGAGEHAYYKEILTRAQWFGWQQAMKERAKGQE